MKLLFKAWIEIKYPKQNSQTFLLSVTTIGKNNSGRFWLSALWCLIKTQRLSHVSSWIMNIINQNNKSALIGKWGHLMLLTLPTIQVSTCEDKSKLCPSFFIVAGTQRYVEPPLLLSLCLYRRSVEVLLQLTCDQQDAHRYCEQSYCFCGKRPRTCCFASWEKQHDVGGGAVWITLPIKWILQILCPVYLSCLHCLMFANIVFILMEQFVQI